uniref:Uncharacterized protein n=1 Tax=Physcomitrium patens TaxID=3218 RepID=A0A2K1IUQ5_PHYPA|nr:hypothetical protein PHYPA_024943 [Physcomitrium patens]
MTSMSYSKQRRYYENLGRQGFNFGRGLEFGNNFTRVTEEKTRHHVFYSSKRNSADDLKVIGGPKGKTQIANSDAIVYKAIQQPTILATFSASL